MRQWRAADDDNSHNSMRHRASSSAINAMMLTCTRGSLLTISGVRSRTGTRQLWRWSCTKALHKLKTYAWLNDGDRKAIQGFRTGMANTNPVLQMTNTALAARIAQTKIEK